MDLEKKLIAGCLVIVVLCGIMLYKLIHDENVYYNQLMEQCKSDGHPEYKCVGFINRNM